MEIIYADAEWLVVNKPTDLSTIAAFPGDLSLENELKERGFTPHFFSRLDRGTSGLILIAQSRSAQNIAEPLQKEGKIQKTYEFISAAGDAKKIGTSWECTSPVDGKIVTTVFRMVGKGAQGFRYEADLKSGRKHQIRRHARESGIPILGDSDYHGKKFPRLALHCKRLYFPPLGREFVAATPASLGFLGDFAQDPDFLVAIDRRGRFYQNVTEAYRVVHRGESKIFDFSADVFGSWLLISQYDEQKLPEPYLKKLISHYSLSGAILRRLQKNPHVRGLVSKMEHYGEKPPEFLIFQEWNLKYQATLTHEKHVGFFSDHRSSRRRLFLQKPQRVANLFGYSGSFSVTALASGADFVVTVDSAASAKILTENNISLNCDSSWRDRHNFAVMDVRRWLAKTCTQVEKDPLSCFDFVICDPPTFSVTKMGGQFSVQKEWENLVVSVAKILGPSGQAIFSNNHREAENNTYQNVLKKHFTTVIQQRLPLDFPERHHFPHARQFWVKK